MLSVVRKYKHVWCSALECYLFTSVHYSRYIYINLYFMAVNNISVPRSGRGWESLA
jgi:hypothetical protein